MKGVVLVALALGAVQAKVDKLEDKWGIFCGEPDCYEELGLLQNATKAQIRKAYRKLTMEYHPDKNPGDEAAAEKFKKVARANEVLTNDEDRKKLDYYIENPGEYWALYGTFVSWRTPPKTDVRFVILLLLIVASIMQPALQYSKHQQYVVRLEKAVLQKMPLSNGGTHESLMIRRRAEEKVQEKKAGQKKSSSRKMTHREERTLLEETIKEIIAATEPPYEFRKPSAEDAILVRLFKFPKNMLERSQRKSALEAKGENMTEDEKQELIEFYLGGAAAWEALSDNVQDSLIAQDCWKKANFDAWKQAKASAASASASAPLSSKSKRALRQRKKAPANFVMDE